MKKTISILITIIIILGSIYFYFYNPFKVKTMPVSVVNTTTNFSEDKFRILAIGDSLTAGYGLNLSESYPSQLEQMLITYGKNVEVINAGISGETSTGLLERIDFIISQNPEMVLVTIGGNDALRALPVDDLRANLQTIVRKLKTKVDSDKIFIMQMQAPLNLGLSYVAEFNSIYSEISKSENVKLLKFIEKDIFTDERYIQGDGIHPNKEGYKLIIDKYIFESVLAEVE